MDDREIVELLNKLEPRKASSRMDDEVLAASRVTMHQIRARMRRRRRVAWAGAAAVLLASFTLFQALVPEKEVTPRGDEAAFTAPPSREALAARARLLELKLTRIKRLAALVDYEERYSSDLESLDRILMDIDLDFLRSGPTENDMPEPVRQPNGGKSDEESSTIHRLPVDPDAGRLRPGRRPC